MRSNVIYYSASDHTHGENELEDAINYIKNVHERAPACTHRQSPTTRHTQAGKQEAGRQACRHNFWKFSTDPVARAPTVVVISADCKKNRILQNCLLQLECEKSNEQHTHLYSLLDANGIVAR